jgi:hypothetical protein
MSMSKKERRLVKKAARALTKLQRYRDRHAPSADEAAARDIERTVLTAGWPREAAEVLLRAGVGAREAARRFSEALRRPQ